MKQSRVHQMRQWRGKVVLAGCLLGIGIGLLTGCGTRPPAWQMQAAQATMNFRELSLQGHTVQAQARFDETVKHLRRAGDMPRYVRLLLNQQALVLLRGEEPEPVPEELSHWLSPEERALQAFYRNPFAADAGLLAADYRNFLRALATGDVTRVVRSIERVRDPLRQLICAEIYLRQPGVDAQPVRALAIGIAAEQAWTGPLVRWLRGQAEWAQRNGDEALRQQTEVRIRFIEGR